MDACEVDVIGNRTVCAGPSALSRRVRRRSEFRANQALVDASSRKCGNGVVAGSDATDLRGAGPSIGATQAGASRAEDGRKQEFQGGANSVRHGSTSSRRLAGLGLRLGARRV